MIVDLIRLGVAVATAVVVTRRVVTAESLAQPGFHIDKNGDIHEQPEGRGRRWQLRHALGLEPSPVAAVTTNQPGRAPELRPAAEAMAADVRERRKAIAAELLTVDIIKPLPGESANRLAGVA